MRKRLIVITAIICMVFATLLSGCASKKDIENTLLDAKRATSQSQYEEARGYYKQVLEWDNDNREALYGLEDLEKAAANHDQSTICMVYDSIVYCLYDPSISGKIPEAGDYSLDEFLNNCGKTVKTTVLKDYLYVDSVKEISDKLVSVDQDGNPIKGKEIRVGVYKSSKNGNPEISVYVPGSYDVGRNLIIHGGVAPKNI